MKANRSRPSLGSMKSTLYDTIDELGELATALSMDPDVVSMTGFLGMGATLKSIILQIQAIKELVRQRKEAIPKGKIYRCIKFPTLFRIWRTESNMETLEVSIARFTEQYMSLGRKLQPELFSDTNRCLLQEEANNRISPEKAMVLFQRPTTEDIRLNNKESEQFLRESKTVNSCFGKWNQGTKVTEDGESRA